MPPAPQWEAQLDAYPTRAADEDPRWALWLFWIWGSITVACIAGIVLLLILGWFYD